MSRSLFHSGTRFPQLRTRSPITAFINGQLGSPFERAYCSNVAPNQDEEANNLPVYHPRLDLSEDGDNYYVDVDLPGVEKSAITITIEDGVLSVSAPIATQNSDSETSESENAEKAETAPTRRYLRRERARGRYEKQLYLGDSIDENNVAANFSDGVLALTLPKPEDTTPKPRTVPVH